MRKPLSSLERTDMERIYPYYGAVSIVDYVDDYIFDAVTSFLSRRLSLRLSLWNWQRDIWKPIEGYGEKGNIFRSKLERSFLRNCSVFC